jgi:hypothetical protein
MQEVLFTCLERPIFWRAHCFSPRCSWQHASNNRKSDQLRPVRFPMWSRQKAYPRQRLRRLLIHKKMFEYSVRGSYLQSAAFKRGDMQTSMRWAVVMVAICSWITISNHCAFAAIAPHIETRQTECPFHSKPAKQKQPSSHVECCKILRAVVFAQSNTWARDDAKFNDLNFPVETGAFLACSLRAVAPLSLDTGPPLHPFSFAELILQQSLPTHAPPLVA